MEIPEHWPERPIFCTYDRIMFTPIPHLTAQSIAVARGGRLVLRDLGFTITGGTHAVLRGANGSGKSTLLRAICGLTETQNGSFLLNNAVVDPARLHYVAQADPVKPHITPYDHAHLWARLMGQDTATAASTAKNALARFGLAHVATLPARFLSAGQKRRLSLCRLLLSDRPVWLLDEPFTALDDAGAAILSGMITAHAQAGGISLTALHGDAPFAATHIITL